MAAVRPVNGRESLAALVALVALVALMGSSVSGETCNAGPAPGARGRPRAGATGRGHWLLNAESNAAFGSGHRAERIRPTASAAPCSRSMPASSHSTETGPS